MASVSLFRRWRSQKFADLVGQEAVVRTLQNVLVGDAPARAYLFCGPRGTGKTSSARIFAKALNCENGPGLEPCNECGQCRAISEGSSLDVFEIDAASHTQVDKIREFIVEKVHFSPVSAKKKVYIIDEVHKLSTSSFNALLKTLEEPPSHVVFILATTHPHELPPTILSRCQRYDFRPLSIPEIRSRLLFVAEAEAVSLESQAADQLARAADGSLRDALVLFEQAVTFCGDSVKLEPVLELMGMVSYQVLEEMLMALHAQDTAALIGLLHRLTGEGRDLKRLADAFLEHLRLVMLLQVRAPDSTFEEMAQEEKESLQRLAQTVSLAHLMRWIKAGMELTNQVREGRQAKLLWETTLVALANPGLEPSLAGLEARLAKLESGRPSSGPAPASGTDAAQLELSKIRRELSEARKERLALKEQLASPAEKPGKPEPVPEPVVQKAPPPPAPKPEPVPEPVVQKAPPPPPPAPKPVPEPVVQKAPPPPPPPAPKPVPEPVVQKAPPPPPPPAPEPVPEPVVQKAPPPPPPPAPEPMKPKNRKEFWVVLLQSVRERDKRLHAMLADAKLLDLGESKIVLGLPQGYDWHREMILKSTNLLEEVTSRLCKRPMRLECHLGEAKKPASNEEHQVFVERAAGLFAGDIIE